MIGLSKDIDLQFCVNALPHWQCPIIQMSCSQARGRGVAWYVRDRTRHARFWTIALGAYAELRTMTLPGFMAAVGYEDFMVQVEFFGVAHAIHGKRSSNMLEAESTEVMRWTGTSR